MWDPEWLLHSKELLVSMSLGEVSAASRVSNDTDFGEQEAGQAIPLTCVAVFASDYP